MTTALSDLGLQFASGNVVDMKATMPTSGTYTVGDIVLESNSSPRISGWKRLTTGSTHGLGTDWAYISAGTVFGVPIATTSGTFIDFTGIPSWVRRITVMLRNVSTNGTSNVIVQLGTAGSIETTGYEGGSWQANVTIASYSSGFMLGNSTAAATNVVETLVINLFDPTNFSYVAFGTGAISNASGNAHVHGGTKALSAQLTRLRLTTVSGADTFDAGSANVMYE